ncbi:hypothetical protein JMN32_21005 [Fulvivirga sp. 29W222]|uniref:Fibrobacter succinogenes major paralogous domain-containing protein n=1 Tax=Fulvivirga marina TaxID=2494733 RepID=A0A937KDT6_9BACT|nr:FISUMP domain-containing protein [Fulvivirga marina]MBL6448804.1 hypothetical protein [Fulvivirga marina]
MKQNLLSLFFTALVLTAVFSLSSCGGDDDGPAPDPCLNTTLVVTTTSDAFDITATATGGESPYEFSIDGSTFQTSGTFEDVAPKEYTVTVKDANACTNTTKVTVADACADLAVTAAVEEYTVEATATGGTAPYEYSLDGTTFQTTTTFADVVAADYTLTVKDANACTATIAVTASDLESLLDERDGQRYKIVTIGEQVWMAENLDIASDTARYCYNEVTANCDEYGSMYSWYAAKVAAPDGWHLPSKAEYDALIAELGPAVEEAAPKLIVGGSSGFEGKLGGRRKEDNTYAGIDVVAIYWTADEYSTTHASDFSLQETTCGTSLGGSDKNRGLYIRCIKD